MQMIDVERLTSKDVGAWVQYFPYVGEPEKGRIKWWNDIFVFVVYKCDGQWDNYHDYSAAATKPNQLRFLI